MSNIFPALAPLARLVRFLPPALVAAALWGGPPQAHAATPAIPVLSTGFDDIGDLPGWQFVNLSIPAGTSWFQGNAGIFPSQAGAADAYVAANFLSAAGGAGSIDNWMITPQLSLPGAATLTFFTRGAATPGFSDTLEVRYSTGGDAIGDFSHLLLTVGGASAYPSGWQQYSVTADPGATVRFAFRYTGSAGSADYVGVDTVVITAVPEPSAWLMLAAGLALLLMRPGWQRWNPWRPSRVQRSEGRWPRALAAGALLAASHGAMAAGQDGMIMVRDAETGAMRPATAAEFATLRSQQAPPAATAPQVTLRADGTRQSRVAGRAVYSVATRGADGKLDKFCVQGAETAQAALQRSGAGQVNHDSGEHSHEHH